MFLFWGILGPELKATQRNFEFLNGNPLADTESGDGLHGALWLGRIKTVGVVGDADDTIVEDLAKFKDYSLEGDDGEQYFGRPYLLRVQIVDSDDRVLQIHCRLTEDYLGLKAGLPVMTLLLSDSERFDRLAALTDIYVLQEDRGIFVGDYPYLNRLELERWLAEDDKLWEMLLRQEIGDGNDDNTDDPSIDSEEQLVPVQKKR